MKLLINEKYFKENSPIPINFNLDEIIPFFSVSEKMYVLPILGEALYEELLAQVCENNLTRENSELLLEIYPYLSFSICYEALPFISYHFSEVGITKGYSDNSTSVSQKDMSYIENKLKSQMEQLKEKLKEYLNKNADNYPLYRREECYLPMIDSFVDSKDKYERERQITQQLENALAPKVSKKLYYTKRYNNPLK
nr:MAG: hypothetical protein [Bacteriophage sp.]